MGNILGTIFGNIIGGPITTGAGGFLLWENLSAVFARMAKGESPISVMLMTPEGQAVIGGLIAIMSKGPNLAAAKK